jgi:hypothetical protein
VRLCSLFYKILLRTARVLSLFKGHRVIFVGRVKDQYVIIVFFSCIAVLNVLVKKLDLRVYDGTWLFY